MSLRIRPLTAATLIAAIRAVRHEARSLHAERAAIEGALLPDQAMLGAIEADLMTLSAAAAELRDVYEELHRSADNLPLYSRLIA